MTQATSPIPEGVPTVIPQLVVSDAKALLAFLEKALGAQTQQIMPNPSGEGIMHATVTIGDGRVFVSDASDFAKPTQANTFLYVTDVDAAYAKAVEAGATGLAPVSDMFWGDRWGMVADPFGNIWQLATHTEDLTPEQIAERMQQAEG